MFEKFPVKPRNPFFCTTEAHHAGGSPRTQQPDFSFLRFLPVSVSVDEVHGSLKRAADGRDSSAESSRNSLRIVSVPSSVPSSVVVAAFDVCKAGFPSGLTPDLSVVA